MYAVLKWKNRDEGCLYEKVHLNMVPVSPCGLQHSDAPHSGANAQSNLYHHSNIHGNSLANSHLYPDPCSERPLR
jgi:hypothetical protein